jgi:hypothetical protein
MARADAASNIAATLAMIALEILFPIFRLQKPVLAGIRAQVRTQHLYGAVPGRLERRAAMAVSRSGAAWRRSLDADQCND